MNDWCSPTTRSTRARCRTPTRWRSGRWRSSPRSTATSSGSCRWDRRSSSAAAPTCARTGQIGAFRFSGQSGVAAGVRRIEAVTGRGRAPGRARAGAAARRAWPRRSRRSPSTCVRRVEQLIEERQRLEARLAEALKSGGGRGASRAMSRTCGGVHVTIAETATRGPRRARPDRRPVPRGQAQRGAGAVQQRGPRRDSRDAHRRSGRRGPQGRRPGQSHRRAQRREGRGRPHFASAGAGDPSGCRRRARPLPSWSLTGSARRPAGRSDGA